MRTAFLSTAELEQKLRVVTNQKKRARIRRQLYLRWKYAFAPLGERSARGPLTEVNFGALF